MVIHLVKICSEVGKRNTNIPFLVTFLYFLWKLITKKKGIIYIYHIYVGKGKLITGILNLNDLSEFLIWKRNCCFPTCTQESFDFVFWNNYNIGLFSECNYFQIILLKHSVIPLKVKNETKPRLYRNSLVGKKMSGK